MITQVGVSLQLCVLRVPRLQRPAVHHGVREAQRRLPELEELGLPLPDPQDPVHQTHQAVRGAGAGGASVWLRPGLTPGGGHTPGQRNYNTNQKWRSSYLFILAHIIFLFTPILSKWRFNKVLETWTLTPPASVRFEDDVTRKKKKYRHLFARDSEAVGWWWLLSLTGRRPFGFCEGKPDNRQKLLSRDLLIQEEICFFLFTALELCTEQ